MSDFYVIEKPDNCEYLTVEQSIWKNGERHLANSVGYASQGRFGHADGSMRKALRNFSRAKELSYTFAYSVFTPRIEWMVEAIAASIMHGT